MSVGVFVLTQQSPNFAADRVFAFEKYLVEIFARRSTVVVIFSLFLPQTLRANRGVALSPKTVPIVYSVAVPQFEFLTVSFSNRQQ